MQAAACVRRQVILKKENNRIASETISNGRKNFPILYTVSMFRYSVTIDVV